MLQSPKRVLTIQGCQCECLSCDTWARSGCSKSGGTCANLQVALSAGNPCLCFCCRPAPPPKHCPAYFFTFAFYQQIHSKSLLPHSPQGEPGLIGLFGSKVKNNFNIKKSTHTILWSEHKLEDNVNMLHTIYHWKTLTDNKINAYLI